MIGEHDRDAELAKQRDEVRCAEAWMADLDDVANSPPIGLGRQQCEEFSEIGGIEFLGWRELPQYRTKPVLELEYAGTEKTFDGIAGLSEHATVGRKSRALH